MKRWMQIIPILALVAGSWWLMSSSKKGILGVYYSSGVTGSGMDRTGSPLSGGSTCGQCHGGGNYSPSILVDVKNGSGVSVTQYVAGETYTVSYTFSSGTGTPFGYGFQNVALTSSNANAGNFTNPVSAFTKITTLNSRKYVEHSQTNTGNTATVTWVAPGTGTGNVTFYSVANAVNGNGGSSGDQVSSPNQKVLTEFIPTAISYSSLQYCGNQSNPSPTISGTQGGAFSSGPNGLIINASSGAIDLAASTVGQYTVTYTYTGGSTSTNVIIYPTYNITNTAEICSNDSIFLAGVYRKNPGTYISNLSSINGCDSIVSTTLSVKQAYNFTTSTSICNGDSVLIYGTYRKLSGMYQNALTAVNGCDSNYTSLLTVLPVYSLDSTITICQGDSILLFGNYYKSTGTIIDSSQTSLGCDSVTNVQLNVLSLDLTVSVSGITLTALQNGASYQWLDCDNNFQAILGATQQDFTPNVNGNYTCEISNGICSKRSTCYNINSVSIDEIPFEVKLSPNPSSGVIQLTLTNSSPRYILEIIDIQGHSLYKEALGVTKIWSYDLSNFEKGTYFIRISGQGISSIEQFILN